MIENIYNYSINKLNSNNININNNNNNYYNFFDKILNDIQYIFQLEVDAVEVEDEVFCKKSYETLGNIVLFIFKEKSNFLMPG
jgi:hypothetical protein